MKEILAGYAALLGRIDAWFARAMADYPGEIRCGEGCSACCRGLFDITFLDGLFLAEGFARLAPEVRETVRRTAAERIRLLRRLWPEWEEPFFLNHRPEEAWEELMPDEDETPCVLLGEDGRCLVYEHRPMTCRLHGLPLVDTGGELCHDEWCTLNFVARDPLAIVGLRESFLDIFREEGELQREVTLQLLGEKVSDLDWFIPAATLAGDDFDWRGWWLQRRDSLIPADAERS